MNKTKIIELLNQDLQDEHGAIVQYLAHAYGMGEGELSCEVEAIAREEMRHLDWLAETIVELGGKPSVKRGGMRMGGDAVPDWMGNDVRLEEDAIAHYEDHIKQVDDPKIKRLLQRILADENAHHGKFAHFVDKSRKEGLKDQRGQRNDETAKFLNWGVGHEYTVILQYMFHSYMAKKAEARKQLEDQAINEMQHLGWLAEELIDAGGAPMMIDPVVNQVVDTQEALRADIAIEKDVAKKYGDFAARTDDAGLKELLTRIRDNELYHQQVFNDLLQDGEK
jgi:bacterioferritin